MAMRCSGGTRRRSTREDQGFCAVRAPRYHAVLRVAPHSLHARPLVVPRGKDVTVVNRTVDVSVAVLVDGHEVTSVGPDGRVEMRLGPERSLLATLPEATFVRRYRESFAT